MKTKQLNDMLKSRDEELRDVLKSLKSDDCQLSKNTISTKTFHTTKERRIVALLLDLAKAIPKDVDIVLSEASLKGFNQLVTPQENTVARVIVQEGDRILELMEKYADVKKLKEKMDVAASNAGCRLDFASGLIVKV